MLALLLGTRSETCIADLFVGLMGLGLGIEALSMSALVYSSWVVALK